MKPITLNSKNAKEKLTDVIKEVEGKSSCRQITAEEIIETIASVEKRLNIPKNKMRGITLVAVDINAQTFPSAYHYTAHSTQFDAKRISNGWAVTKIYRGVCTNNAGGVLLTEDAKNAIIHNFERVEL